MHCRPKTRICTLQQAKNARWPGRTYDHQRVPSPSRHAVKVWATINEFPLPGWSPFRPGSALPLGERSLTILRTNQTALGPALKSRPLSVLINERGLLAPRKAPLLHGRPELPHGQKPRLRRRSNTAKQHPERVSMPLEHPTPVTQLPSVPNNKPQRRVLNVSDRLTYDDTDPIGVGGTPRRGPQTESQLLAKERHHTSRRRPRRDALLATKR